MDTPFIASRNPIRYRGYYYDEDTKLYYLNARYYSPEWHRYISPAQAGALNSHAVNGLHLYSYANNNPVNMAYSGFIGGEIANSRTIRTIGLSAMTEGPIISPRLSLPALPRWTEYATTALDMFSSLAGVFETSIWAITSTGRAFSDFHYTAYGINRFTMIDQLTSPLGNVCKKLGVGLIFADIGMNLYNCIQQDYSFAQGAISVTLTAVKDAGIYYASARVASAVGGYIAGSKLGVALGSWAGPAGMIVGAAAGIAVGYLIDEFGDAVISWLVGLFD